MSILKTINILKKVVLRQEDVLQWLYTGIRYSPYAYKVLADSVMLLESDDGILLD